MFLEFAISVLDTVLDLNFVPSDKQFEYLDGLTWKPVATETGDLISEGRDGKDAFGDFGVTLLVLKICC